jgi:patatin-like phospholipase/acyl hydrolase
MGSGEKIITTQRTINILSIDGGGIRGIIPAKILAELEEYNYLKSPGKPLYEAFDIICGTSTGAIIAIGIALGVPAKDILKFYTEEAKSIFPKWPWNLDKLKSIYRPQYSNKKLLKSLHDVYAIPNGRTALLNDAKTRLCIPTFNGGSGEINVLKTKHNDGYVRDFKIPAHHAALSSASAPIYFPPHSFTFSNEYGKGTNLNMIDGGLFANNPTLIGIFEATDKLDFTFSEIKILSLGTGQGKHILKKRWKPPSFRYWLLPNPRLFDIIIDSQSQITEQYISFLNRSLEKIGNSMVYKRIQYDFQDKPISLNTSASKDIERLEIIGEELSKKHLTDIYNTFF